MYLMYINFNNAKQIKGDICMFETIFTTTADNSIDITQAAIAIGAAFVIGFVIAAVYMFMCKKERYQKNFIIGLAMLPAVVAVVILLVGSNVARAFSMAGAFALVRFRSAPGSAKDISIVFFTMAAGLACGLGYVSFATVFVVVMLAVLTAATALGFADVNADKKQLKITIPENLNYNSVFDDVFEKYTSEHRMSRVKTTNMGTMYELTYEVKLKDESTEKEFIDQIRVRNGNLNISMAIIQDNGNVMLN